MSTSTPITDAVESALIYAKPVFYTEKQYDSAWEKLCTEVTDEDKEFVNQQSAAAHLANAAALRILADEVKRLLKEMTRYGVSHCCKWRAVTAGVAGSTCWWECSFCRKPCRIIIPNNNTQPQ